MEKNKNKVTVQGVINPVPAAVEGEKTGSPSSRSYYCNTSTSVAHLAEVGANATGNIKNKEQWNVENPFRRNSIIQRTPPTPSTSTVITLQDTTLANVSNQEPTTSKNTPFMELGNMITELINYMKDKNNIHHAIKRQARDIKAMYNKVKKDMEEKGSTQSAIISEQATQTTPKCSPEAQGKRCRDSGGESPKIQLIKRSKNTESKLKEQQESKQPKKGDILDENSTWKLVKRKENPRKKRERNEAMIISTKGETTYADILRQIKGDQSLKDLGESVNRIRRTQKGELLLEIKAMSKGSVDLFRSQMEKSIGAKAEIKTRRQEITIECKDIDEITTKEDICNAFQTQLEVPEMRVEDIKSLRRAYGGTQTAIISLPSEIGYKALQNGKVKIGWVVCRLRERVILKQCYRCLGYGHMAASCKNPNDRSKLCRRCGKSGHIAKDCRSHPECMLCKEKEKEDVNHVAGSGRCPIFKEALEKRRR